MFLRSILVFSVIMLIMTELSGMSAVSAQDQQAGVKPSGRQAVVSGTVSDVDRNSITIEYLGDEIDVDAAPLVNSGGSMRDYYEEGMMVTVEGTLTDKDEMVASRITGGAYRGRGATDAVTPYIVNNPGIIQAEDLD